MKIEGLPVIDVDESEEITVAVRADDLLGGDTWRPRAAPIALALRRQKNVDDARVTKNETLVLIIAITMAASPRQWYSVYCFAHPGRANSVRSPIPSEQLATSTP
jgi:hypothetical protein